MLGRVAVHLARGGEQEPRALPFRKPERVVRSVGANLQRLERQAQVVDRAGGAREVEDEVDRLVDLEMPRQIVVQEDKALAAEVLDVLERSGLEVVHADDPEPVRDEGIAEMRAEKACTSRDDGGRHSHDASGAPAATRRLNEGFTGGAGC